MVKSVENGTSLPPFLVKCYEMVSDESTNELISWTESNDSFIIWDESSFSSRLLPKYFKHSNFSSFVRQLNIYGFRKIDTDRWQFANEAFIKGQKDLLKNITRRKQPHSAAQKRPSQPTEDPPPLSPAEEEDKRLNLWKEVEDLKTDKNALMLELKKVRQHQQTSQSKLRLLREQMKGMEKHQQQMLSFIVLAMQSPEFMVQFFQTKESNWRMAENGASKLSEVTDDSEPTPSDRMIVRYQPQNNVPVPELTFEASETEELMELDFSSDEMRDLFMEINTLFGPMDEKRLSVENHGQFVLPDLPENDDMLEQLLLSNPASDDAQFSGHDTDSGMDIGFTSELQEIDKSSGSDDDAYEGQIAEGVMYQSNYDKVDVLTKQMVS